MNAILNYLPLAEEWLPSFGQSLCPPSSSRQSVSKSIEEDKMSRFGIEAKKTNPERFLILREGKNPMNEILAALMSAPSDELLKKEFQDLFYQDGKSETETKRRRRCTENLISELDSHHAKSDSLEMNFEDLPILQVASTQKDNNEEIHLDLSPKRHEFLVLCRHSPAPKDRLDIIPWDFLDPRSAALYAYFLIDTSNHFFRDLAFYKSSMVATNCRLFSHGFLAPGGGGKNHCQAGPLDCFPLPKLTADLAKKLDKSGRRIWDISKKLIRSMGSPTLQDFCNPKKNTLLAKELQKVDDLIDPLYGLNRCNSNPITEKQRRDVLLQIYAKMPLRDFLKTLLPKNDGNKSAS